MKHFLRSILPLLLFLCASLLSGCVKEDEVANNPRGNFEALWRIIDEHYCFFDYMVSTGMMFMRVTASRLTVR